MKDSVASMISRDSIFTARRPDKAKHQPKVRNITKAKHQPKVRNITKVIVPLDHPMRLTDKNGNSVLASSRVRNIEERHRVWRGGVEYWVTKRGLEPV